MAQKIDVKSSLSGKVVNVKKGMIFNNASQNPDAQQILGTSDDEDEHLMVLPLLVEKGILGTLNLYRRHKLYLKEDIELAQIFALYISTAIQNAQAYQELIREIKERKQTEEALKNSEQRLKIIFELAPDAIYLTDLKGTFIDGNKTAENILGYKKEELIGKSFLKLKLLHAKELLKASKLLMKNVQGKGTGPDEFLINRKDGTQIPVEISTYPVKIKNNIVVLGIARDITKHKQAEDVLAIQRQRLADILEGTNAGTWDWNVQTGELTINERWAEIIGYTLKELEPIDVNTWINNVHTDDLPIANALLDKHFNRELDYYDVVFRQPHKDGRWVWINARGKVIEWTKDDKPLRMSGTHLDITNRKQAEEKLKSRNKELETWAEVTTDRELFMLNLKKEINELLEKSGEKPKYEIPV